MHVAVSFRSIPNGVFSVVLPREIDRDGNYTASEFWSFQIHERPCNFVGLHVLSAQDKIIF